MIIYFENTELLKIQYKNIIEEFNFHINFQNKKLLILVESIINLSFQSNLVDDFKIIKLLEEIFIIIGNFKTNINTLSILKDEINSIFNEFKETENFNLNDEIKTKLQNYNKTASVLMNKLFDSYTLYESLIQKYIKYISLNDNNLNNTNIVFDKKENTLEEKKQTLEIMDNSVLLISEKEGKVFLPYTIEELNKKLETNSRYKTLQQIIDSEYILPLSRYRNPIISRFREAYNLMKYKENASIIDCLDLSMELSFNSSLNPAIITACKNLDELDEYLDCLDSNKLEKFDIFEIKYDILPFKIS